MHQKNSFDDFCWIKRASDMKICDVILSCSIGLVRWQLWANFKFLLLLPTMRQKTVCFFVVSCHGLPNCNVIALASQTMPHMLQFSKYTLFWWLRHMKCNLFGDIDYIGCLVIARNVTVTMAANHCNVQLFQFNEKTKMKQFTIYLRSNRAPIRFFFSKSVSFLSIKRTRIDSGRHLLELLRTVKHVYIYTEWVFISNLCTADTSQSTEFWCDSTQLKYIDNYCLVARLQKKTPYWHNIILLSLNHLTVLNTNR